MNNLKIAELLEDIPISPSLRERINKIELGYIEQLGLNTGWQLSDEEKRMLALFDNYAEVPNYFFLQNLNLSARKTQYHLDRLKSKGYVKECGRSIDDDIVNYRLTELGTKYVVENGLVK